jgi:hypothetical protein
LFRKAQLLAALYLAAAFCACAVAVNELDSYFYELRPDLLSGAADALFWFFAPALVLTLAIGGNPHGPIGPLLDIFGFAQAYLVALLVVVLVGAIRRGARRPEKPAG